MTADLEGQRESTPDSALAFSQECVDSSEESNSELKNCEDSKEHFAKVAAARMSFKAPQWWMLVFGNVLTACAGCINTTAFKCTGSFATHVTGFVSTAAMRLEDVRKGTEEPSRLDHVCAQIACFFIGAYLCGLVIPKPQVNFGGKALYGAALIAESVLLFVTAFKAPSDLSLLYTASMAAGLQNAMCTLHFSAVVRTTHLTGTSVDIASTLGRITTVWLRRCLRQTSLSQVEKAELDISSTKLLVLCPLFFCFFAGSYLGVVLYGEIGHFAFLVPAVITGAAGIVYSLLRDNLGRTFQAWQMSKLETDLGEVENLLQHSLACLKRHRQLSARAEQPLSQMSFPDVEGAVSHLQEEMLHLCSIVQEVEAELESLDAELGSNLQDETNPMSPSRLPPQWGHAGRVS